MNCLPCFQGKDDEQDGGPNGNANLPVAQPKETPNAPSPASPGAFKEPGQDPKFNEESERTTKNFTFRELAMATKNFRQESLLGEGAFGRIFKGTLKESGQIVAVRQLDKNGLKEGGQDFVMEVATLNYLEHKNLVNLIGYCADGEQRLLVYEYMPSGSLKAHLFDLPPSKRPLDWSTRMKIALGVAEALEYLHENSDPQIIYRELKSSNIMLADDNTPKLSEYGLSNLFQESNNMMHTPRVISHGYRAPEYEKHGDSTVKSDVYSFGVIMLELITGRKAMDPSRPANEQNLVEWAQPYFRDRSKYVDLADPLLRGGFAATGLNQAIGVAAMCIQEEPTARPLISDISAALSFLAMAPPEAPSPARIDPISSSEVDSTSEQITSKRKDDSTAEHPESSNSSQSEDVESANKKHKLRGKMKSKLKGLARKHKDKKNKKMKDEAEDKDKKKKKLASKKSRSSSISSSDKTEESQDYDYGSSSDEEELSEEDDYEEELSEEEEEMSEEEEEEEELVFE